MGRYHFYEILESVFVCLSQNVLGFFGFSTNFISFRLTDLCKKVPVFLMLSFNVHEIVYELFQNLTSKVLDSTDLCFLRDKVNKKMPL